MKRETEQTTKGKRRPSGSPESRAKRRPEDKDNTTESRKTDTRRTTERGRASAYRPKTGTGTKSRSTESGARESRTGSSSDRRSRAARKKQQTKRIQRLVTVLVLCAAALVITLIVRVALAEEEEWTNPFLDVNENMWSYPYITELNKRGVIPSAEKFLPTEPENRGNLILYLYNMDQGVFLEREKQLTEQKAAPAFSDVEKSSPLYDAVVWGYQNGLVSGVSETSFAPDDLLTREQVCTILTRFAALENISFIQVASANQFKDSLDIQNYARSGVTACQLAGLVKGYEDGYFRPADSMSRQECAAVTYRVMTAAESILPEDVTLVDLTPGAYDDLYNSYKDITHVALVPPAHQELPTSFFDQAVFIGDSISLTLESYCGSTGALSKAQFLCAGSMSPTNMLTGQILPEYPKGSGQKPAIEESVAATGAKLVYIMLGMDNIAYGLEKSTGDYVTILDNIQNRNPEVEILVQGVTPMTKNSKSTSNKLNNDAIDAFNARMLEICQEKGWYYLDVGKRFKDEEGYLKEEYCSDKSTMGMHFTYEGAKIWVDYLRNYIPEDLAP